MKSLLLFISVCFLIATTFVDGDDSNLWNLQIKQEQVVATVTYQGRILSVWKQDVQGQNFSRYYVTPICVLHVDKLSCNKDTYATRNRWIFNFKVKLWDNETAEFVKSELKAKNFEVETRDIQILPMQRVRVGIDTKSSLIKPDKRWRANQDQRWILPFELYPKNNKTCYQMFNDATNDAEKFLTALHLYFEFSMVAASISSRNISISGQFLTKSDMFNELKNMADKKGGVGYLTSKDANKLAHDVVNQAIYQEEVSSDYVPAENEDEVVNALLKEFQKDKISSEKLSKEKWDSVFWDDIFTRPDVQTSYFNNVLKYDEKSKDFKYNKEKDRLFREKTSTEHTESKTVGGGGGFSFGGFGISAEASVTNAHGDAVSHGHENQTRDVLKFNDVKNSLKKDNVNVKWTGKKFEQKNLDLYRMNTRDLSSKSQICYIRSTVTKQEAGSKIFISAEEIFPTTTFSTSTESTTTSSTTTTTVTTTTTKIPMQKVKYFNGALLSGPYNVEFEIGDGCRNFIHDYAIIRSIQTSYHCFRIYMQLDCKGESYLFTTDSRTQCDRNDLTNCPVNNKVHSLQLCE